MDLRVAVQPSDELPGKSAQDEPRGGPTVLRIMLGNQLRRLREESGITPDEAAYEIRGSRSKIDISPKTSFGPSDATSRRFTVSLTAPEITRYIAPPGAPP